MKKIDYTQPEVKALEITLEHGFAASVETGFGLPSYESEDVSNNWK